MGKEELVSKMHAPGRLFLQRFDGSEPLMALKNPKIGRVMPRPLCRRGKELRRRLFGALMALLPRLSARSGPGSNNLHGLPSGGLRQVRASMAFAASQLTVGRLQGRWSTLPRQGT